MFTPRVTTGTRPRVRYRGHCGGHARQGCGCVRPGGHWGSSLQSRVPSGTRQRNGVPRVPPAGSGRDGAGQCHGACPRFGLRFCSDVQASGSCLRGATTRSSCMLLIHALHSISLTRALGAPWSEAGFRGLLAARRYHRSVAMLFPHAHAVPASCPPAPMLSSDGGHCSWLLSLSGRCWCRHVQACGAPSIHPHAVHSHAGCADRQARGVHCHADPPEAVPGGDGSAWRPARVVCCWSLYLASKCT